MICTLFLALAPAAEAACRQALVLALDISSSVEEREYDLQMQGLADALLDPEVMALVLLQSGAPIDLAIFEWGGRDDQRLVQPWVSLRSQADLKAVAQKLRASLNPAGTRPTALGPALDFAADLLAERSHCWSHVVDISGDGKHNIGPRPSEIRRQARFDRITVNALVIGTDAPPGDQIAGNEIAELSSYFRAEVLHGANAFLETALGFSDFQRAMKAKLLRELDLAVASTERLE